MGLLIFDGIVDEGGVYAASTLYVGGSGAGNYSTIQTAIDAAGVGDTIRVYNGTYYENVLVNKTVTLIGNGSEFTKIDGGGNGHVLKITADWVNISGFSLYNSDLLNQKAGLIIFDSKNCKVENNNCSDSNYFGIYLALASYCRIYNNSCNSNDRYGINLLMSNNNILENNSLNSNHNKGIFISSSSSNIINNNYCESNWIDGIGLSSASKNTIENNICLSHSSSDGIQLSNSNNNLVKNNTCLNNSNGIGVISSSNNILENNTCESNYKGIYLSSSTNNVIEKNYFNLNNDKGIRLYGSSNNFIKRNELCFNTDDGIEVFNSDNIDLEDNNITNNSIGIDLRTGSDNCQITNTTILNSSIHNMQFDEDSDVTALNCSLNYSKINYIDSNSKLTVKWFLHIKVVNETNIPVSGANVKVKDKQSNLILSKVTNSNGCFKWIVCKQYIEDKSGKTSIFTPYNLSATKIGYDDAYAKPQPVINRSMTINLILIQDIIPPDPPTNLIFTSIGGHHIKFSWAASGSNDVKGYNIYINDTGSNTKFHYLANTTNLFYNLTGLLEETTYYFKVKAFDEVPLESGSLAGYKATKDITKPNAPENLIVNKVSGNYINLSWSPSISNDVQGYQIYINNTGSIVNFHYLTDINLTYYNCTGLVQETIYYFKVRAYDEVSLFSIFSNIVSSKTLDITPPIAPSGLVAIPSGTFITLYWNANSETDIQGYQIYINDTGAGATGPFHLIQVVDSSTTQLKVSGLIEETTYHFFITAFDEVPNISPDSIIISSTALDVTAPQAPLDLRALSMSGSKIKLLWNPNTELDIGGYIIYMNDTNNGPNGNFHEIHKTIGFGTKFEVNNLMEETEYYFKIKAYDEVPNNSSFSEVVWNITYDETPPSAPTGLKISNITYNCIKLTWSKNLENDLVGYNIYRKESGSYHKQNLEPIIDTHFIDSSVQDNVQYYYKISAIDEVPNESDYSEEVNGITPLRPKSLKINDHVDYFEMPEDSYDDKSINLFDWFSDPNDDELIFWVIEQTNMNVTIFQENGTVILRPQKDYNGLVRLEFYAHDGRFDPISSFVTVNVTAVNDPPDIPEIVIPKNNTRIEEGILIDFKGKCNDLDLLYGDILTFKWYSNLSGDLGASENLNDIILPTAKHKISLEVTDQKGASSINSIYIAIVRKPQSDNDGDLIDDTWELEHGLNPDNPDDANEDYDNDQITNFDEYQLGTDPQKEDTDNDGISDGDEINIYQTNPTEPDTDGDGYKDKEDDYPLDNTKWEKEDEKPPDKKKPDDKKGGDSTWLFAGVGVVIVIIVVILLFFLLIKRKKKGENDLETSITIKAEKEIQQLLPQKQPPLVQTTPHPQQPQMQPEPTPQEPIPPQPTSEQPSIPPQQKNCTTCAQPLTFYSQNNQYYCNFCKKYE